MTLKPCSIECTEVTPEVSQPRPSFERLQVNMESIKSEDEKAQRRCKHNLAMNRHRGSFARMPQNSVVEAESAHGFFSPNLDHIVLNSRHEADEQ